MKLSELAKELPEKRLTGDAEIAGVCTDSRLTERGDLFIAYSGVNCDLHRYAVSASERGAAALVTERELPVKLPQLIVPDGREALSRLAAAYYGHPEKKLTVLGVTGTNGKTTTTHLLRNMLEAWGKRVGLIGTLGISYAGHSLSPALTTPDPITLFSLFSDFLRAGVEYAVMEVSAHALFFKKELPVHYEVGIFTNLTRDHLDFFADMQAYGAAKKSMFARCKRAVLNADDPFSGEIEVPDAVTYGLEAPADSFAVIEEEGLKGSKLLLNLNDALCEARLPLTGRHNVLNTLAAASAAHLLGADMHSIAEGMEHTRVEGRLEWTASFRGADIFVDFAHTPDGLEKSLTALRPYCRGRLILLFGCGGNRDEGKREPMGEIAARLADFCVLTSDNPRYEDPCDILWAIERGYHRHSSEYVAIEERNKATEYAISLLKSGDVLLIAGKGGETYQEIMGIKYGYNDKTVIEEVIRKLS